MGDDNFSCIKEVTKTVHVALPTAGTSNEISGISDVLESWKRQYIQQLKAIVVGYRDVSLTSVRGYIKIDNPVVHYDVSATFELFYPIVGSILKGKINRICHDYIGCLVHNTINVTIDNRPKDLPTDVANLIVLDRFILFEITRLDHRHKIIRVIGKLTQKCVDLMKESDMFNFQNESKYAYSSENATNQTRHIVYSDEENNGVLSDNTVSDTNQYSLVPVVSCTDTVLLNKTKKEKKKKHLSVESNYASAYSSENATNQMRHVSDKKNNSVVSDEASSDTNECSSPVVSSSSETVPLVKTKEVKKKKHGSFVTDSNSSPKKKHKGKISNELDLSKINSFADQTGKAGNLVLDEVSSDHLSLLAISDIKKEPLDQTKKGKKRTREESGDAGSPAKKKRKSDGDSSKIKDKVHGKKKRKDKSKKDSKRDKRKKLKDKVISTKKKLEGYINNLKKKNKDKKEKTLAKKEDKSKAKKDSSKTKKDKLKTKKDRSKDKKDRSKNKKGRSKDKKIKTEN